MKLLKQNRQNHHEIIRSSRSYKTLPNAYTFIALQQGKIRYKHDEEFFYLMGWIEWAVQRCVVASPPEGSSRFERSMTIKSSYEAVKLKYHDLQSLKTFALSAYLRTSMKNIPTKKLKNTKRMCGYILYLYHAYFRISIFSEYFRIML